MSGVRWRLGGTALLAFVSSCATSPDKIKPVAFDAGAYATWSCAQLGAQGQVVEASLDSASSTQRIARKIDMAGVALAGIPAASILGGNHATKIARLKGEQISLWRLSSERGCVLAPNGRFESAASSAEATP